MVDLSIPAKETFYDGIWFRSRTEARWAYLWQQLGVTARYEQQGFKTTPHGGYLPDFYVWAARGLIWVEIKGSWEQDPNGIAKFRDFAARRPQPELSRAALLIGSPEHDTDYLVIGGSDDQDNPLKGPWEDDTHQWRPCPGGYHFDLAYPGRFRAKFAEDGCPQHCGGDGEGRLRRAIDAARTHRFDGSDSGTVA